MSERTIKGWITISGRHIPVYEGAVVKRAVNQLRRKRNKTVANKINEDKKLTVKADDFKPRKIESETERRKFLGKYRSWLEEEMPKDPEYKNVSKETLDNLIDSLVNIKAADLKKFNNK